ncbi:hypothetical protein [Luteimonas saliphila]|uniref:hypothetical protein n=1 Tax=Luteimonas saliphila TaxID=2804919 RepID=UPI00192DC6B8|nr:hypothetical protein [Luteimonas saliphila]
MMLAISVASPVWAETFYFCFVRDPYNYPKGFYVTPIRSTHVERVDERKTGSRFAEWLTENSMPIPGGSYLPDCLASSNADFVREQHGYYDYAVVDWPGEPTPEQPKEQLPTGAFLVIEDADPPVESPEVLAARALASERQRAAAMAGKLAEIARRDAELDAMLREVIERAKRRGSMQ